MDNKEYLEKILPHKKPMILIDDIIKYSLEDNWLESIVTIREDSIFYDKNIEGISSIVGIEYMAQTIGCYAFLRRKQEKPHIGFLLGTRLYNNSIEKFSLGKSYIIKVSEIFTDNSLFSFDCFIYDENNDEVASAMINVYQDEKASEVLVNG
jgi:predicted hotdog family 3-hydroxylacyl-ACP dehydratase